MEGGGGGSLLNHASHFVCQDLGPPSVGVWGAEPVASSCKWSHLLIPNISSFCVCHDV